MTDYTTDEARRIVARLRSVADLIESAARFGVDVPHLVSVGSHEYGNASFHASEALFAQWFDYLGAEENLSGEDYTHAGQAWSRANVVLEDGLPLEFACKRATAEVTA